MAIAAPGYSGPWLQWTLAIVALGYTGPEPLFLDFIRYNSLRKKEIHFTKRRVAWTMLYQVVHPFGRLSVRLLHASIVSKWLNVSPKIFHFPVAPWVFQKQLRNSDLLPLSWVWNKCCYEQFTKLWDGPVKVVETEEDQRTHGRGQLRRSWEAWNWAGAKRKARHKIGRFGRSIVCGLCSGRSWKAKKKKMINNYSLIIVRRASCRLSATAEFLVFAFLWHSLVVVPLCHAQQ